MPERGEHGVVHRSGIDQRVADGLWMTGAHGAQVRGGSGTVLDEVTDDVRVIEVRSAELGVVHLLAPELPGGPAGQFARQMTEIDFVAAQTQGKTQGVGVGLTAINRIARFVQEDDLPGALSMR